MLQQDLNNNWIPTILYYCYQSIPGRTYDYNAVDLGTWGYNENDNLIIVQWYPTDISQPSIETLLFYDLNNVTDFFNSHYQNPFNVSTNQPFVKMTTSRIDAMNNDCNYLKNDYLVYDTDLSILKKWNGTAFVALSI